MKTISQIAKLTGISVRTLQYYDEIHLLKPSELTASGYRLYNDEALQRLQQILFFKELGFQLNAIKDILSKPDFDKIEAYKKQKQLLLLKRSRIDRLIELLGRLEKGEQCMSFKEFSLDNYIEALEHFKNQNEDDIINNWGSTQNFDLFIEKVKEDESDLAKQAILEFGSVEKYTEAMQYNMEHFSELMEQNQSGKTGEILKQSHDLYSKLTADMERDITSDEIQKIVHEIVTFTQQEALTSTVETDFWDMIIDTYSKDLTKAITDTKYGPGAAGYIAKALHYYFHK